MDLECFNIHSSDKILADTDEFSEKLNLHKIFVKNNNIQKTYYCLTWYFESNNIDEYFKLFINDILDICGKNNIQELTATVEKTKYFHIHLVIMFKRTCAIYSKLNKKFKNINIEVINKLDFENVKSYCSKEFTRIVSIFWKFDTIYNILQPAKLNKLEDTFEKAKEKALVKALNKNYCERISDYKNFSEKNGIPYNIAEIKSDLKKLKTNETPIFLGDTLIGEPTEKYNITFNKLKDVIKALEIEVNNSKTENIDLIAENSKLKLQITNLNSPKILSEYDIKSKYKQLYDNNNKLENNYNILFENYNNLKQTNTVELEQLNKKYKDLLEENNKLKLQNTSSEILDDCEIRVKYNILFEQYKKLEQTTAVELEQLRQKYEDIQDEKLDKAFAIYDIKYNELLNTHNNIEVNYGELVKLNSSNEKIIETLKMNNEILSDKYTILVKSITLEDKSYTISNSKYEALLDKYLNAIESNRTEKITLENTYTLKINALNFEIKALKLKIETKNYD